jgi:uncharacterized protein YjiS (DUF1127 family)
MAGLLTALLTRFSLWRRRAVTRRHLRDLPPHLLDDIGLDAAAREEECAKWPFEGDGAPPKENGRCLRAPVSNFAALDRATCGAAARRHRRA